MSEEQSWNNSNNNPNNGVNQTPKAQPWSPNEGHEKDWDRYHSYTLESANRKNHIVAGILGLFFGVFGVHNFYTGHYIKGVIQLLLTVFLTFVTFGLSLIAVGIWSFIESILYLVGAPGSYWRKDAQGNDMD